MLLMWKRLLIAGVSVIAFQWSAVDVPAQDPDPSPEQCTCDLEGFDSRTGADVVNAATCVQELRHPWCDIYIAAVEDSRAHNGHIAIIRGVAKTSETSAIKSLIKELLDRYVDAVRRGTDFHSEYDEDIQFISKKLRDEENSKLLYYCLDNFLNYSPTVERNDGFGCAVGSESGWLNIQFTRDDRVYRFLFAPAKG